MSGRAAPGLRRWVASRQTAWIWVFFLAVLGSLVVEVPSTVELPALVGLLVLAFVRPPRSDRAPVAVASPVRGRWVALNSPGSAVPSHGVRAYGQTFAVDLLHPRPPGAPTAIDWGLRTPPARDHSSFGEPVLAVAEGTVVAASGSQRDHRARTTWPALLLMLVEGSVREAGGARWVLGNHVVVQHDDATCSAYAHLRRGSLRVRRGDRVAAGQQLGEVGNSGNSSEPHLHFQLMDRAVPAAAAGVPFRWTDAQVVAGEVDAARGPGGERDGVPANGQVFVVLPHPEAGKPG